MHSFERPKNLNTLSRGQCFEFKNETDEANSILKDHKLSRAEYSKILEILDRPPTKAELGVFSAMWSEHCSYKSSKVHLKRLPTSGEHVVVGPGENAGVIRLWKKLCVAFKMESHNHPSFIDPYQGAATGVGGILRDIFCMGARPIANLNSLRFGHEKHPKTKWLVAGTVKGIGDYGNCVGVPTVGGSVSFDESYNGNILVNAMSVGLIHEDKIFKGKATGIGNLIIYLGSPTGRDGIHGATMASDSFDSKGENERSAVQVGDPFWEKLLMEATLEALDQGLVEGIQDMGAAGLTSSLFEMADRAKNGLFIDLDSIPVRTSEMSAYELLLSESQERMIMVIKQENWSKLEIILRKWDLSYAIIGSVTNSGRVEAMMKNKLELDVPVAPLAASSPTYNLETQRKAPSIRSQHTYQDISTRIKNLDLSKIIETVFLNIKNLSWITHQYDQHIGNKTIYGSSEEGSAILWLDPEHPDHPIKDGPNYLGISISVACKEKYCNADSFKGSILTVLKAARTIVASGAEPLAITDCLNFGNPQDPFVMGSFSDSIDGISEACKNLKIPVISGNVSFYNETDGKSIAPSPMIGMVGKINDIRNSLPAKTNKISSIFLVSPRKPKYSFTGSEFTKLLGIDTVEGELLEANWKEEFESFKIINKLSQERKLTAARDVGSGGIMTTCLKMVNLHEFGVEFKVPFTSDLIAETNASYIIVSSESLDFLKEDLNLTYCNIQEIGRVIKNNFVKINNKNFKISSYLKSDLSSLI